MSVRWRCAPDEAVILQFFRKNLSGWSNLIKGIRVHKLDPHLVGDWIDVSVLVARRSKANAIDLDGREAFGGPLLWPVRRYNGIFIVLIGVFNVPDVQDLVFSELLPIKGNGDHDLVGEIHEWIASWCLHEQESIFSLVEGSSLHSAKAHPLVARTFLVEALAVHAHHSLSLQRTSWRSHHQDVRIPVVHELLKWSINVVPTVDSYLHVVVFIALLEH